MIDNTRSRRSFAWLKAQFAPRRIMVNSLLFVYSLSLFLGFDFLYTAFTRGQERERIARVADPIYDHGLVPNFDGYDIWGEARYRFFTNSLGFKDGSVRDVPLKAASRRILLMGDSFTEAIGIPYEDTFFGLLNKAAREHAEKIEFLDGGVASYSPSIYYKKIKYLLDQGLQFDEVVLLSDSSDVEDESTSYFCIDDDPKYRRFCTNPPGSYPPASPLKQDYFVDHFAVTNRIRITLKRWIQSLSGNRRRAVDHDLERIGWAMPHPDLSRYRPLGIEEAIERSIQNMGKLSDLLASRGIPLTIVVYPWAQQLAQDDRDSRQVRIWRDFCATRCKAFIDLFPAYFAIADRDKNWYEKYFIIGDDHYSVAGNRMLYEELAKRLLP